jgi:hypothetical protein
MSDEAPKPPRKRSPYTGSTAIFVEFTVQALPPDETRERRGRPERSPSLPPIEEPKTTGDQPPLA